ncbi:MAG: hypothetical protein U0838_06350 [Chloroflexota bacterium]
MDLRRRGRRGLLAGALTLAALLGPSVPAATAAPADAFDFRVAPALAAWTGGFDLYRSGVFTTQKSWLWCTAASIQITRNIVFRQTDHTASGQRTYFNWMRAHNKYTLPLSAGVDAQGWAVRLPALRQLDVQALPRHLIQCCAPGARDQHAQDEPAGGHHRGQRQSRVARHGLHGHRGPCGQQLVHGHVGARGRAAVGAPVAQRLRHAAGHQAHPDPAPSYFTPWRYAPQRMVWDGKYVSVQP